MQEIKFKKLNPAAAAPVQATVFSAGFDLTAVSVERIGDDAVRYGTGIAVEIPEGHVGLLFPRSSCYKTGQTLANCVGVIDADSRGEIKCVFSKRAGSGEYKRGDRVAQLMIVQLPRVTFTEAEELSETVRGAGGFGSTGK